MPLDASECFCKSSSMIVTSGLAPTSAIQTISAATMVGDPGLHLGEHSKSHLEERRPNNKWKEVQYDHSRLRPKLPGTYVSCAKDM